MFAKYLARLTKEVSVLGEYETKATYEHYNNLHLS